MKLLSIMIASLTAGLSMAQGEVQMNWPSVNGLPINTVCATETTFRSVRAVPYCTAVKTVRYAVNSGTGEQGLQKRQLKDGESVARGEYVQLESVCAAYATQGREVSRNMTVTECAVYAPAGERAETCSEFGTKTVKAGLTYSVEKLVNAGEATQQTFVKYTIPTCPE